MGKTRKDQRSRVVETEGQRTQKEQRQRPSRSDVHRRLHQVDVTDFDELDDMADDLPTFEKF